MGSTSGVSKANYAKGATTSGMSRVSMRKSMDGSFMQLNAPFAQMHMRN